MCKIKKKGLIKMDYVVFIRISSWQRRQIRISCSSRICAENKIGHENRKGTGW